MCLELLHSVGQKLSLAHGAQQHCFLTWVLCNCCKSCVGVNHSRHSRMEAPLGRLRMGAVPSQPAKHL